MKLTFLCLGSRGDVQPYVALGIGFQHAGYQVRIATNETFKDLVVQHGLEFALVQGSLRELFERDSSHAVFQTGGNVIKLALESRKLMRVQLEEMLDSVFAACEGSDALLYGFMGLPASHMAEYWKLPYFPMMLQPATRTGAFPAAGFPELPLGPAYNHLTWELADQALWLVMGSFVDKWRREQLGLPGLSARAQSKELYQRQVPFTYGYSEHVVPRPADYPAWHRVTGYWFLEQTNGWSPPAGLADFIQHGTCPIYVGFGSMNTGEAERTTRIVLEALKDSGQRAVLLKGWGGLRREDLPDTVYMVDAVPHEWLFPQMSAIVHHGGAGTTAAAFRSGVPQVVLPHFGDQPFWAERVRKLGVGPRPVYMNRLNAAELSQAIRQAINDRGLRTRAELLGEKIRAEDGVGQAVEIVDEALKSTRHAAGAGC